MNKSKSFSSAFSRMSCVCLTAAVWPLLAQAQQDSPKIRRPAASRASSKPAPPAPAETATSTPAPDADSGEKTPPTDDDPTKEATTQTDIDASESATFNSKDRVAVFTGNVKVTDPRFQLVCDRLTVFLSKAAPAGQNAAATPAPTPTPTPATGKKGKGDDSATPSGGGGIDHAVAEGHVVILQKKAATKPGEEEKISIGRGEVGTFDNKTGDMTLKGWPSLEQNGSSLIASAEGTVMTIHRDSSLDTNGPSKTKLIQHGKGGGLDIPTGPSTPTSGGRNGTAAPAGTSPRRNAPANPATPATSNPR